MVVGGTLAVSPACVVVGVAGGTMPAGMLSLSGILATPLAFGVGGTELVMGVGVVGVSAGCWLGNTFSAVICWEPLLE